jgi:hypothetical protein
MSGKSQKPHRNLVAWQKGMDLVMEIYKSTQNFPQRELYGLSSQLRRAALSVPSNIAEGAADRTYSQFSHFLANASDPSMKLIPNGKYLSDWATSRKMNTSISAHCWMSAWR